MAEKGILIVVSGFSGAGKGTLMKELLKNHEGYALSVSATTRDPRPGEVDGVDYFFLGKEEFLRMIGEDAFYEYAEYQGNYYGTPRRYVDEQLDAGRDVILEIDVQGAGSIKKRFPDTVLIFVTTPSFQELKARLEGRGSETPEKIRGRLSRAAEEAAFMPGYDYILVNDDLQEKTAFLHAIIRAEHAKSGRMGAFIENMSEELRSESART